jgi:hypothetical protein
MDEASVKVSVTLGFAWQDQGVCRMHNDFLLAAAARSEGRIVPFITVNPGAPGANEEIERCVRAGARGIGELRPGNQGWEPAGAAGELLAAAAARHNLALLFHVTEPAGHKYPGKEGGPLSAFYAFVKSHAGLEIIGAHLAGGLPFYAPMPEVREALSSVYLDTAATRLLYDASTFQGLPNTGQILFGSDFPLGSQRNEVAWLSEALPDERSRQAILRTNGQRLLARLGVPVAA